MRVLVSLSVSLLVAAAACTAAPEAPATPTWDEDVYPVIKGNCLHCHGGTSDKTAGPALVRFDVCNVMSDVFMALTVKPATDVISLLPSIMSVVEEKDGKRAVMPPAPAHPLTDYELKVLTNWRTQVVAKADRATACKKTSGNRRPTATLIKLTQGSELIAELDVTDPDGDQVFGRVTTGNNNNAEILSAGHHVLKIRGGTGEKLTLKLTDGYDVADITLQ